MRKYLLTPLLGLAAIAAVAGRILPLDATQADIAALDFPYVKIAGKAAKLAPGSIIYDENNRSILPVNLPAKAKALYQLDATGDIQRIWLLSAEEAQATKSQKSQAR